MLHFSFSQRVALRGGFRGPPSLSSFLGLEACLGWAGRAELWGAREQGPGSGLPAAPAGGQDVAARGRGGDVLPAPLTAKREKVSAGLGSPARAPASSGGLAHGAGRRRAERGLRRRGEEKGGEREEGKEEPGEGRGEDDPDCAHAGAAGPPPRRGGGAGRCPPLGRRERGSAAAEGGAGAGDEEDAEEKN